MSGPENPPAFPMGNPEQGGNDGMALRDWFAGQIIIGLLHPGWQHDAKHAPAAAYQLADAMLSAREVQS